MWMLASSMKSRQPSWFGLYTFHMNRSIVQVFVFMLEPIFWETAKICAESTWLLPHFKLNQFINIISISLIIPSSLPEWTLMGNTKHQPPINLRIYLISSPLSLATLHSSTAFRRSNKFPQFHSMHSSPLKPPSPTHWQHIFSHESAEDLIAPN